MWNSIGITKKQHFLPQVDCLHKYVPDIKVVQLGGNQAQWCRWVVLAEHWVGNLQGVAADLRLLQLILVIEVYKIMYGAERAEKGGGFPLPKD